MTPTFRELGCAVDDPQRPASQPAGNAHPPSAFPATIAAPSILPDGQPAGESYGNSPANIAPLHWAAEIARNP